MKFKERDRVKHKEYGLGTVVELNSSVFHNSILVQFDNKNKDLHEGGICRGTYEDETCWHFTRESAEKELELIKCFKKSDLKDGDIITHKNGEKTVFSNNKFIKLKNGEEIGNNFTEDLIATIQRSFDIVKVERPVQYEVVFERKEEILDASEKRYLTQIIRPFKNKVNLIEKVGSSSKQSQYIRIALATGETIFLPYFKKNTMYRKMEDNRPYTLEELKIN